MANLRDEAKKGITSLLTGLEDGEVEPEEARQAWVSFIDALIPSGPFEGVERVAIEAVIGSIIGLVQRARSGRNPDKLRRRARRLRERAERLERLAEEASRT